MKVTESRFKNRQLHMADFCKWYLRNRKSMQKCSTTLVKEPNTPLMDKDLTE